MGSKIYNIHLLILQEMKDSELKAQNNDANESKPTKRKKERKKEKH